MSNDIQLPTEPSARMAALENAVMNFQSIIMEMENTDAAKNKRIAELACQRDQYKRGWEQGNAKAEELAAELKTAQEALAIANAASMEPSAPQVSAE